MSSNEDTKFPYFPAMPSHCIRSFLLQATRKILRAPNYPSEPFDPTKTPPPPNYNKTSSWLSRPSSLSEEATVSESELITVSETFVEPEKRKVDCFFLHPTTFWGPRWNQNVDMESQSPEDKAAVEICKYWTQSTQASVFNESCRVWSPHYRQCTLLGLDNSEAMAVAYKDCKRALLYFLDNIDRNAPFVLASHSQGGYHLGKLLEDIVDKNPSLRKRLVCAYLVGSRYPMSAFGTRLKSIKAGKLPNETGVVVGWDTLNNNTNIATRLMYPSHETLQINPITWTTTTEKIDRKNGWKGAINVKMLKNGKTTENFPTWNEFFSSSPTNFTTFGLINVDIPNFWVKRDPVAGIIVSEIQPKNLGPCASANWLLHGWYHCEDYSLFWKNIRENVKNRVDTWIKKNNQNKQSFEASCLKPANSYHLKIRSKL